MAAEILLADGGHVLFQYHYIIGLEWSSGFTDTDVIAPSMDVMTPVLLHLL